MDCWRLDSHQAKQLMACLTAISKQPHFVWLVTMNQSLKYAVPTVREKKNVEAKQYGN